MKLDQRITISTAPVKTSINSRASDEDKVLAYMQALDHPLKAEIEAVRAIIKSSSDKIAERIKLNAPSYYYKDDIVTFNCRPIHHVHLVFHHPAIVDIQSNLLLGEYKDRRIMYFSNMREIKTDEAELQQIIRQLVNHIDNK